MIYLVEPHDLLVSLMIYLSLSLTLWSTLLLFLKKEALVFFFQNLPLGLFHLMIYLPKTQFNLMIYLPPKSLQSLFLRKPCLTLWSTSIFLAVASWSTIVFPYFFQFSSFSSFLMFVLILFFFFFVFFFFLLSCYLPFFIFLLSSASFSLKHKKEQKEKKGKGKEDGT